MKERDLEADYSAAVARVRQPHLDRLRALGVAPATIARVNLAYPAFGIASGEIVRGGVFVPGDGPDHIVQPVVDGHDLVDLVAWRSATPQRWGLRSGLGWLLNADFCLASWWDGDELTLHASPLAWLVADATGGVIVDWDAPDLSALRGFARIRCGDAVLGAALKRTLSRPVRMPFIETVEARYAA